MVGITCILNRIGIDFEGQILYFIILYNQCIFVCVNQFYKKLNLWKTNFEYVNIIISWLQRKMKRTYSRMWRGRQTVTRELVTSVYFSAYLCGRQSDTANTYKYNTRTWRTRCCKLYERVVYSVFVQIKHVFPIPNWVLIVKILDIWWYSFVFDLTVHRFGGF